MRAKVERHQFIIFIQLFIQFSTFFIIVKTKQHLVVVNILTVDVEIFNSFLKVTDE